MGESKYSQWKSSLITQKLSSQVMDTGSGKEQLASKPRKKSVRKRRCSAVRTTPCSLDQKQSLCPILCWAVTRFIFFLKKCLSYPNHVWRVFIFATFPMIQPAQGGTWPVITNTVFNPYSLSIYQMYMILLGKQNEVLIFQRDSFTLLVINLIEVYLHQIVIVPVK